MNKSHGDGNQNILERTFLQNYDMGIFFIYFLIFLFRDYLNVRLFLALISKTNNLGLILK